MPAICMYFQVHQPIRLRRIKTFDAIQGTDYWDDARNRELMDRAADKCYLPANRMILELIRQTEGSFRVAFSISGTFLEQAERFRPDVVESFRQLARTGHVEFLAETYYHSLAGLWDDPDEFYAQVDEHARCMRRVLGVEPTVFRNTELIFDDRIAQRVQGLGYQAILTEGADKVLGDRRPNHVYRAGCGLPVLLKNYRLSDDVAFRFSAQDWPDHPLTARKYAQWLADTPGETINLFMDYETFGEHQWKETGIFDFLWHLPREVAAHPHLHFALPSEVVARCKPVDEMRVPWAISWADAERDVSAWLGNRMQQAAFEQLKGMAPLIQRAHDPEVTHTWRLLQTSDHIYYASTKALGDGDVHSYFSPYDSPYLAYINHINAIEHLRDVATRLAQTPVKISLAEAEETSLVQQLPAVVQLGTGGSDRSSVDPAPPPRRTHAPRAAPRAVPGASAPQGDAGAGAGTRSGEPADRRPGDAPADQAGSPSKAPAIGKARALVQGTDGTSGGRDEPLRSSSTVQGVTGARGRALVTGGAGFIGSHVVDRLLGDGWDVHVVDDLQTGRRDNLPKDVPITYADVASDAFPGALADVDWDIIVHLASPSSAVLVEQDPLRASQAVHGFQKVLDLARHSHAKVALASTSGFYAPCAAPSSEEMPVRPATLYEFANLAMEQLAQAYAARYGVSCVALRLFSVYGPREQGKGPLANVVSQFLWSMRRGVAPVVYGDGQQTRDFTYVDDAVQGLMLALDHADGFDVYNVGTGRQHTLNEVVTRLNAALQTDLEPKYVPNPVHNYVEGTLADAGKLQGLGWRPKVHLDEGIRHLASLADHVDDRLLQRITA